MGFKDLDLDFAYETIESDPVEGFYIPTLAQATRYDRIAGFFTSTSLALAARGIAGLINNKGHMRLIVSPKLTPEDADVIRNATEFPQEFLEQCMINELDNLTLSFEDNHVRALGWMLAQGYLEIRIACITDDDEETTGALFHQKVGIMEDAEGNKLSFSGSINETATGWLFNSEEFKVFNNWVEGEQKYFNTDEKKFNDFWLGLRKHVKTFRPSEAFDNHLIKLSEGFDAERLAVKNYKKVKRAIQAKESISLFDYQREAVDYWDSHGRRLLFEMATGTGKTRTAIACVNVLKQSEERFVCIVAAPEITLARQWENEFLTLNVSFDEQIYADSSTGGKTKWRPQVEKCLSRMLIGRCNSLLIMTTHDTACSENFTSLFASVKEIIRICFVGDEVHGLGSRVRQRALLERYEYRIGLSATPARWFDEEGTSLLCDYFGNDSFIFGISEALNTINPITGKTVLTPYKYRILFLKLTDSELEEYLEISEKIAKLSFVEDEKIKDHRDLLMMQRANILKNAVGKYALFSNILKRESLDRTLVFTSPQQIDDVCALLSKNGIAAHPFTMNQGTKKTTTYNGLSEREYLIQSFKKGYLKVLVAISCLDEGIDIPCAEKGILLASSTNPREYIQRIGRVIRPYPGKENAEIIDFVVEPDWSRIADEATRRSERIIFAKELNRVKDMARNALNSTDVLLEINKRLESCYGL